MCSFKLLKFSLNCSYFNILACGKESILLLCMCDHWVQSGFVFVLLTSWMDGSGTTFYKTLFLDDPTFSGRLSWGIFIHLDFFHPHGCGGFNFWAGVPWDFKASAAGPISTFKSLVPGAHGAGSGRAAFWFAHLVLPRILLGSRSWMKLLCSV